jgi:hypothetical protein
MEGAEFRPSDQGSHGHRRSIPERPRKAPALSTLSARRSTPRLLGDEALPNLNRNSEDSQEPAALAAMEGALEQTDKLPALVKGRSTRSPVLDASSSVPLQEDFNEEESDFAEARERDQRRPPDSAGQQWRRSSPQSHTGEHAFPRSDVARGETWHIPVAGEFAARRSLFRSVLSWLTGK